VLEERQGLSALLSLEETDRLQYLDPLVQSVAEVVDLIDQVQPLPSGLEEATARPTSHWPDQAAGALVTVEFIA
jgi:hypothetical protein